MISWIAKYHLKVSTHYLVEMHAFAYTIHCGIHPIPNIPLKKTQTHPFYEAFPDHQKWVLLLPVSHICQMVLCATWHVWNKDKCNQYKESDTKCGFKCLWQTASLKR
jgi:hypothetical protein